MRDPDSSIDPGRYSRVVDAVVSVSSDLSLAAVLRRIVETATDVVGARYGALGVVSDDGRLREFVHTGFTDEEVAAIGSLPVGRGLLGALIDDPEPVRLDHLSNDPRSAGFPAHHPPMDSFLGVPIQVGKVTYGNLYLTEKIGGPFTAEDQAVATLLASSAGAAVGHALAHEKRNEEWLSASREMTQALISNAASDELLLVVVRRIIGFLGVESGYAAHQTGPSELTVMAAITPDASDVQGRSYDMAGSLGARAMTSGDVVISNELSLNPDLDPIAAELGAASIIVSPLPAGLESAGVICGISHEPRSFSAVDIDLMQALTGQAAVVLEVGRFRAKLEQMQMVEDRERIARELHDTVIQRIFATGMSLQAIAQQIDDPDLQARQRQLIDQLDDTISDIRSTIFTLQAPASTGQVRVRVQRAVAEVTEALQFRPALRFDGPLDSSVDDDLAPHLVAVVREALANVAKHAGATTAAVRIGVDRDHVTITVADDGIGFDRAKTTIGKGLGNMSERAREFGGVFSVHPSPDGGTQLLWRVPLAPGQRQAD